jgi:hypothetical protein
MQTRGPQKPVSRKGREGASPSRRTKEHWLSGYSSAPLRRRPSGVRRFESCMLRLMEGVRTARGARPESVYGPHGPPGGRSLTFRSRRGKPSVGRRHLIRNQASA